MAYRKAVILEINAMDVRFEGSGSKNQHFEVELLKVVDHKDSASGAD